MHLPQILFCSLGSFLQIIKLDPRPLLSYSCFYYACFINLFSSFSSFSFGITNLHRLGILKPNSFAFSLQALWRTSPIYRSLGLSLFLNQLTKLPIHWTFPALFLIKNQLVFVDIKLSHLQQVIDGSGKKHSTLRKFKVLFAQLFENSVINEIVTKIGMSLNTSKLKMPAIRTSMIASHLVIQK